jgi:hypothetical protein
MSAVQKAATHSAFLSAECSLHKFLCQLLAKTGILINGIAPCGIRMSSFGLPEQLCTPDNPGLKQAITPSTFKLPASYYPSKLSSYLFAKAQKKYRNQVKTSGGLVLASEQELWWS